jgi:hypothetical protein
MAQGQTSTVDAPDTLPADFFDKKNSAPDTLPGNFFEKKKQTKPADVNLPGATPRLIEAAKAGKTPGAPVEQSEFEKQNTPSFFGKAVEVARRFTQGAGLPQSQEASDYSIVPGLKQMLTHPVESAKLLGNAALDSMKQRNKLGEAAETSAKASPSFWDKASKYANAATYYAEGTVPFIGPALGQIADSAEQAVKEKNPWEAAGAGAEALGAGATLGLAKSGKPLAEWVAEPSTFGKIVRATGLKRATGLTPEMAAEMTPGHEFQPSLANTRAEIVQHAAKHGVDLTPAQATGSPFETDLQSVGERSLVRKPLQDALAKNQQAVRQAVVNFAEKADPQRLGLSDEAAGESAREATQAAKDVAHTNAGDAFKNLKWASKTPVDPAPISKKWIDLRESLPIGVEDQIMANVPRNMRAAVEEMLSPTGMKAPLTMEQGIALRSFFREMGETEGLPSRIEGAFKQMEKATDSALDSATTKAGVNKEWRDANQGWKDYATKYGDKQSVLYKVLREKDPAKAANLLKNASARDIEILKQEGMTAALEPLKRRVVTGIASGKNPFAIKGEGLGGYSHAYLHTLFGPDEAKELSLHGELARRLGYEVNPSGTSRPLMTSDQLSNPAKLAAFFGAAKASMPRRAASYLNQSQPSRLNLNAGQLARAVKAAQLATTQQP